MKASMLNFEAVLTKALDMRPGTIITAGHLKQDFELDRRLDHRLIELAGPVLNGQKPRDGNL